MNAFSDTADVSSGIKAFIVKAEDARLQNSMYETNMYVRSNALIHLPNRHAMLDSYNVVNDLNRQMMDEYRKRSIQHKDLVDSLKAVNGLINASAELRVGKSKSAIVSACRNVIKANQIQEQLVSAIGLDM